MRHFVEYIKIGRYREAKKLIKHMSEEDVYGFVRELGFSIEFFPLYSFISFLLDEKETALLHCCASALMTISLVYIPNSYSMGLFHARRCVQLAPEDPDYKEYLLSFYGIPDKLLSPQEATDIANALELQDPGNNTAQEFFEDIKRGQ